MKKGLIFAVAALALVCTGTMSSKADAALENVALNKPVTLNDPNKFYLGGWDGAYGGAPSTLVDGAFFGEGHQWDRGSVFWNRDYGAPQDIIIDLKGLYNIQSFTVQTDNNDSYDLSFWNGNAWTSAWAIPHHPSVGWGLGSQSLTLNQPINTNMLRLQGVSGDGWFSASEIQAYGNPVPIPAVIWLFGTGIAGLAGLKRRKRT